MLVAKFLHLLGFTVWIGGMFFAYMVLRPVAAATLEPGPRLTLWAGVCGKFFAWVWLAVALLFGSGLYLLAQIGRPPLYVSAMLALGTVMAAIFSQVFLLPYPQLRTAVAARDWQAAAAALALIRRRIGINLILGLATVAIGSLGPLAA